MNLGYKIRKIRELKGFDQKYLASVLGIHQSNYSRIENGTTTVSKEQLHKLAEILEVSPEYIESFDEKVIFQNCSQGNFGVGLYDTKYYTSSDEERQAFQELLKTKDELLKAKDDYIKLLLEKKQI